MAFDSAIVTYTTKTDKVDLVQAAHMNAVQNELITIETILGTGIKGTCADLKTRLAICLAETGAIQSSSNLPCSGIEGQLYYRTSDDQLFCYDGASWDSVAGKVPSGFTNMQVFTSSGTWTKPSNVDKVYVKVVGGGGNGGTSGGGTDRYGGGGGGGYSEGLVAVTGNVTVTVGGAGGTSSFAGSTTPQATGGSNGSIGTALAAGGNGGSGSGGDLNCQGADGMSVYSSVAKLGGGGGNSVLGGGAKGTYNSAGNAGHNYGGGGSGGTSAGAGAGGVVIVYWNQ